MARQNNNFTGRAFRQRPRGAAGLLLAACALPFVISCSPRTPEPENPDRAKAAVALFLMRAGYDRWAAACAHALGKEGKSREEAVARCTIEHSNSGLGHDEIVENRLRGERGATEL